MLRCEVKIGPVMLVLNEFVKDNKEQLNIDEHGFDSPGSYAIFF